MGHWPAWLRSAVCGVLKEGGANFEGRPLKAKQRKANVYCERKQSDSNALEQGSAKMKANVAE